MSEDLFSVLAAIGIIALVYRWFTVSSVPSTGSNSSGSLTALQRRAMNIPRSQIDRLLSMFPQLTENEIRYALVVTRGGVEAVAERVLIRGSLDPPPPNFFPPSPNVPIAPQSNSSTQNAPLPTQSSLSKVNHSLIAKLCLEAFKADQDLALKEDRQWSWDDSQIRITRKSEGIPLNDESNSGLKDRKAKMVLESRWRLLQKEKKGKGAALS
ncbi:hypothetical protein O181_016130 [Austropuccinia psidii MF-1]|uniref:CUE domain-containing protein n=1 Tax=Austropuccinia psidii MF-1 TaxID=1389203 RepID=A0A9Q3C568_9BASI|nr:hypothetical protein [Austropuccinia psidii MF-1]